MKKIKISSMIAFAVLTSLSGLIQTAGVFAANPYGIDYSGGEELGEETVTINPTMIDELTPVIATGGDFKVRVSESDWWRKGYYSQVASRCVRSSYFLVNSDETFSDEDDLSYTMSRDDYVMEVKFNKVYLDGFENIVEEDKYVPIVMVYSTGAIMATPNLYSDSRCENLVEDIVAPSIRTENGRIFVETDIKLYKKDKNEPFTSDELYFGVTDIDAAQSFKILNSDNLMTKDNMFARSAEALQPSDPSVTLRNMFVPESGYIYSQYANKQSIGVTSGADIFVKIGSGAQRDGLKAVFGFASSAASNITFYTKQYSVKYQSEEQGDITGISEEEIVSGNNPSGSTIEPSDGYIFAYWTADKDIKLTDNTSIKAGDPISMSQLEQVIVNEDLTFTAHYLKGEVPAVPDSGRFTRVK